jgi:hypothetical protein
LTYPNCSDLGRRGDEEKRLFETIDMHTWLYSWAIFSLKGYFCGCFSDIFVLLTFY